MAYLTNHANVYRSAIALLDLEGWKITIVPAPYELEDSRFDMYEATRDGTRLCADNPLELLALATIHEHHHPHTDESYWWRIAPKEPGLVDRLQDEALERSFLDYLEREQSAALNVMRDALVQSKNDPETSPEDRIGISRATLDSLLDRFPELNSTA